MTRADNGCNKMTTCRRNGSEESTDITGRITCPSATPYTVSRQPNERH